MPRTTWCRARSLVPRSVRHVVLYTIHDTVCLQVDLKKLGALGINPLGAGLDLQVCHPPTIHSPSTHRFLQAMAAEGAASDSDDDGAVGKADDAQDYSDVELSEGDMDDDDDDEDGACVGHQHVVLRGISHCRVRPAALAQELEAAVQEELEAEAQRAARKPRRRPPAPLLLPVLGEADKRTLLCFTELFPGKTYPKHPVQGDARRRARRRAARAARCVQVPLNPQSNSGVCLCVLGGGEGFRTVCVGEEGVSKLSKHECVCKRR